MVKNKNGLSREFIKYDRGTFRLPSNYNSDILKKMRSMVRFVIAGADKIEQISIPGNQGNQRKAREKGSTNKELSFDYRGILFAGMIIGALGAVMDVGMSIASAMEEVKKQISENCQLLHGTNSFKIKFDNIPISMIYLKK